MRVSVDTVNIKHRTVSESANEGPLADNCYNLMLVRKKGHERAEELASNKEGKRIGAQTARAYLSASHKKGRPLG